MSNNLIKKIIYPARVVDNIDPMMLGRVRAEPLDKNVKQTLEGFGYTPKDMWGPKDPFVCLPLLPQFISQVPDIKERVNLIYQNSNFPYQDTYYVQASFSSPMAFPLETLPQSNKFTSLGDRVQSSLAPRNKDGTYPNTKTKGIFPEPGDNALLGRGASDIIVKKNSVLLRAQKTNNLNINQYPIPNPNRAFLQISGFDTKTVKSAKKTLIKTSTANQETKKLIEWNITNLENVMNSYSGSIRLYSLKPNREVLTDNINYDSDLENLKSLEYYQDFIGLSYVDALKKINEFINGVNVGQIPNGPTVTSQFPFVYRPSLQMREVLNADSISNTNLTDTQSIQYANVTRFLNGVTLNAGLGPSSYNFAIVRSKNEIGKPVKVEFESVIPKSTVDSVSTVAMLGGETVYLLSQKSNKPTDFTNSIYGFTIDDIENKIQPYTSSTVRGEELIELLNLIVRFLFAHVHPLPNMAPVPVATDGTSATKILFELQNAANKILNPNIRIN